ncbi:MAG: PhnD/SsuA/transferrin family substrate-binding protein [Cyanobacteria bacterium P01_D01_bin.156]
MNNPVQEWNSILLNSRYKITSILKEGGMSQTYIAGDTLRPGNPKCVVKKLHPHSQDTEVLDILHRLFVEEANALEKLGSHDQIPRLLAYFSQDKEFYLIQEYIEGHPLSDELASQKVWSEKAVIALLSEILEVLEFVHQQGVIHRDIKPENLIRRHVDGKLVLIDFGAVKRIQLPQENATKQQNITISIGTPGYMPIEQIGGRPVLSSDLYAVGMVGIQALTGQYPQNLPQNSLGEVLWQPQTPVSKGLMEFLQYITHSYHKNRYQTATEALQVLREYAARTNATIKAVPKSLTAPLNPSSSRFQFMKWSNLTGAGAAVALSVFSIGFWMYAQSSNKHTWGDDNTLTVGVLATQYNPTEGYEALVDHIETQLENEVEAPVEITLDVVPFDEPGAFAKAKEQLKTQNWDIAFTTAPLISASAVKNGYDFTARMFPQAPQFESALFVRADSPIKTLDDINSSHTLALREVSSAAGFYMPVYDLYGKSLSADLDNPSFDLIIRKVATGEIDIGAAPYQVLEHLNSKQSGFRIIHQGRAIPLSGLYISPQLSTKTKTLLEEALLDASDELQQGAHYSKGVEIDYTQFLGIVKRVDEILGCANWQENPVQFFCEIPPQGQEPSAETISVKGKVNGYSLRKDDSVHLKLQTENQGIYQIILPAEILDKDPSLSSLPDLAYKMVEITDVIPESRNGTQTLSITQIGQIRMKQ